MQTAYRPRSHQALMTIERPFRIDATLRQKDPRLGIARVEAGYDRWRGCCWHLILKNTLQLPAQRVAEHLLELIGAHPRRRLSVTHAQSFRRRTETQGNEPRVREAHYAQRSRQR